MYRFLDRRRVIAIAVAAAARVGIGSSAQPAAAGRTHSRPRIIASDFTEVDVHPHPNGRAGHVEAILGGGSGVSRFRHNKRTHTFSNTRIGRLYGSYRPGSPMITIGRGQYRLMSHVHDRQTGVATFHLVVDPHVPAPKIPEGVTIEGAEGSQQSCCCPDEGEVCCYCSTSGPNQVCIASTQCGGC